MNFTTIACLDDLTRDDIGPDCEFLYDLVRAPIWQACGLDIAQSPRAGQRHQLAPGFRHEDFRALCGQPQRHWSTLQSALPDAAEAYLRAALPEGTLFLGADMPAWLCSLLDRADRTWLSLGVVAADFGTDRWIGARSNHPALQARLARHATTEPELLAQAYLQVAAVRRRRRSAAAVAPLPSWDGAMVWLGQAGDDPTLIDEAGHFIGVADAAGPIRDAVGDRRLVYRPHVGPHEGSQGAPAGPARPAHAERERAALARITGQAVPICDESLNDLLAMDDDVTFIGLSHPALRDAAWFGKTALALLRDDSDTRPPEVWLAPNVVLSEALWRSLVGGGAATGATGTTGSARAVDTDGWKAAASHASTASVSLAAHFAQGETASVAPPIAGLLRGLMADGAKAPRVATAPAPDAQPAPAAADASLDRQRIDELRLEVEGLKEALRVVLRQTAMRAMLDRRPDALQDQRHV